MRRERNYRLIIVHRVVRGDGRVAGRRLLHYPSSALAVTSASTASLNTTRSLLFADFRVFWAIKRTAPRVLTSHSHLLEVYSHKQLYEKKLALNFVSVKVAS